MKKYGRLRPLYPVWVGRYHIDHHKHRHKPVVIANFQLSAKQIQAMARTTGDTAAELFSQNKRGQLQLNRGQPTCSNRFNLKLEDWDRLRLGSKDESYGVIYAIKLVIYKRDWGSQPVPDWVSGSAQKVITCLTGYHFHGSEISGGSFSHHPIVRIC